MNAFLPLAILAFILACAPAFAGELWMTPDGDDANPGTRARPLATLAGARDAVRRLRKAQPNQPVTVHVRGGVYRLTDTVVFTRADSGAKGRPVVYAAAEGETPVFTSTVPIRGWKKLVSFPPGLPEVARSHVWAADVSFIRDLKARVTPSPTVATRFDRGWQFFTLFAARRRLPRARGGGFNPTNTVRRGAPDDRRTLHYPPGVLRNWPDLRNGEVALIPSYFWISNILPLESVDESARVARTTAPGTYPLGRNGITDRPTAWVENVLEALDQPGEWVLDAEHARLYLWPERDAPGDDICAPLLTELIRVEGNIDYDGPRDEPTTDIVFRGLTFTGGDRFPWHGGAGWGLQHDWERFDSPTALVRLRGAERCAVEDCHFVQSGNTGVRLDLYCRHNRIVGNHLEHLGGVGILLAGYGPGVKDVNNENQVVNNYLHHLGELYWGSPGIFVWQSGSNLIAHNHLHHLPYTGICVTGRIVWDRTGRGECSRTVRWTETGLDPGKPVPRRSWREREKYLHSRKNLILRNDIHNVMQVTGDGNCIYVSGAGAGNVVRENYCHDCDGRYMNAVLRCDDDQNGTLLERNLLCRTRGHGEGIISKGDNDLLNNFILDLRPDERHRGYLVFPYGSLKGSVIRRNVFYSRQKDQVVCFEGKGRRGQVPRLRDCQADYNLYWCTQDPQWGARHLQKEQPSGIETHSLNADPLFVAPDKGDYRFQPDSPAVKLGILPPIPPEETGLEPVYRARYVGVVIHTGIVPTGGMLRRPTRIRIACDLPEAEVRYTVDGSEPTEQSPRYEGPFVLTHPATVRARAFAKHATDLTGAVAVFTAPPEPIREDFESRRVGERTPGAETQEETTRYTAHVSDEQAASGAHSLKFVDGPGQRHPFNPHVFYRVSFRSGTIVGRLALFIDDATTFSYQWRDYRRTGYVRGPWFQVVPGGRLLVNDRELLRLPLGRWVRFEVRRRLGEKAPETFVLRVTLPGEKEPRVFSALSCPPGFRRLDWVGFIANGQRPTTFFVDDIELFESVER